MVLIGVIGIFFHVIGSTQGHLSGMSFALYEDFLCVLWEKYYFTDHLKGFHTNCCYNNGISCSTTPIRQRLIFFRIM